MFLSAASRQLFAVVSRHPFWAALAASGLIRTVAILQKVVERSFRALAKIGKAYYAMRIEWGESRMRYIAWKRQASNRTESP